MKKLLIAALFLFFTAAPAWAQPVRVVASFSILGDMVKTIGGDDVALTVLAGPDTDTHAYEPTPSDARALAAAQLVFVNGLGFEGWMERLIQSSGTKATVITVTKGIRPHKMEDDHDHHEHAGHDHGETDPHAWQNLANAHVYVKNIADALAAAAPDKADAIRARASLYDTQIAETDKWVQDQFKDIAKERRLVITSHDAFGYFANAYGIAFSAPEGMNTESEPSARQVAALIDLIREKQVKSVFLENLSNARMIRQIAAQTGADASQTLYADALSMPDGPAPTYLSMFRHNVPLMAASMKR